jgi:hypothetical protein
MTKKNEGMGVVGMTIMGIVGFATLIGMISPSSNSSSTPNTTSYSSDLSTMTDEERFGHAYTRERMRQEGFNSKEAKQAADAVIRFHRKQNER